MIAVVLFVCGVIAAWVLVDDWLARREERLQRGRGAWSSQFGAGKTFHASGFEDTLPPASDTASPSH